MKGRGAEGPHNRLIDEKSPYLLKHSHNPVDWYPWGEEAFGRARDENKPVFLSVGYSTCHWCNVMEEESFSDSEVASLMNDAFVNIKVDREERPDIDNIYMSVCLMLNGSGGWPLTVIMTPDRRPFYAGTYYPKHSRFGRIGMMELIPRVKQAWEGRHGDVLDSAGKITEALRRQEQGGPGGEALDGAALDAAFGELEASYDPENGGFGTSPKFPSPHNLCFLLRYWRRTGNGRALEMVERTLGSMMLGGIYDHLGFGFHRYSTDPRWRVPHFEKMLYDQAMLGMAYSEAYQATANEDFASAARGVFTYVLRDLTDPLGGFYSAEGADSEGQEGKFYFWGEDEIRRYLKGDAEPFIAYFNVKAGGNFADPVTGEVPGVNILYATGLPGEAAGSLGITKEEFLERMEAARGRLFAERDKRVRPDLDNKILADWNGLMIAAMSKGAQALDEPGYADAATAAADFVLNRMRRPGGRLYHRWRLGDAAIDAVADDYAFFVWGLLELYETTFEARYLKAALELNEAFVDDFWDAEGGGFYFTGKGGEQMLVRQKAVADSAIPSANSVAMLNLLRLGSITGEPRFRQMADKLLRAFSARVAQAPSGNAHLLCALDFALGPSAEVVVAGDPKKDDTENMLRALRDAFIPNKVVLFRHAGQESPEVAELAGSVREHRGIGGRATAYVCSGFTCHKPTTDAAEMLRMLGR